MLRFDTALFIAVIVRKILIYINSAAWTRLSFTNKEILDVESSELVIPNDEV